MECGLAGDRLGAEGDAEERGLVDQLRDERSALARDIDTEHGGAEEGVRADQTAQTKELAGLLAKLTASDRKAFVTFAHRYVASHCTRRMVAAWQEALEQRRSRR